MNVHFPLASPATLIMLVPFVRVLPNYRGVDDAG